MIKRELKKVHLIIDSVETSLHERMNNLRDQLTKKPQSYEKKNTRNWGESREPYLKRGRNSQDFCLSVVSNHFYFNLEPMTFPVKNHHYSEVNSKQNFFV